MTVSNSEALLKRHADTIKDLVEQINDLKGEVKIELAAAKSSGLDVKALNKIVKELLMDSDQREKQLAFEWEVDAYRQAVGLPTEMQGEPANIGDKRKSAVAGAAVPL